MKKLTVRVSDANPLMLYVTEQTHRQGEFGNQLGIGDYTCNMFTASNGVRLMSRGGPEANLSDDVLFVRGSNDKSDDTPIYVRDLTDRNKVLRAVEEYNIFFADKLDTDNRCIGLSDVSKYPKESTDTNCILKV